MISFDKTMCFPSVTLAIHISLSILIADCLLERYQSEQTLCNIHCTYCVRLFKSGNLIFCGVDPDDFFIKDLMTYNISCTVNENAGYNLYSNYDSKLNFLVVTDGGTEMTEKCVTAAIPRGLLTYKTKMVLYDVSARRPPENAESWRFLGSSNVIYINHQECWIASPPHVFHRSFSKVDCRRVPLVFTSEGTPNFQGQRVEAVTFHRPPSTIIHSNESVLSRRYDGMEMNIFLEIAKQLNLSWSVNELQDEVDKWGQLHDGRWTGGIMEALTGGQAEVGFSTLWVSPMQTPYLDYTTSWTTISSTFLVPKPRLVGSSWWSLLRPLSAPVWGSVTLVLTAYPLAAWASVRLHRSFTHQSPPTDNLVAYYLYTVGSLTGGSGLLGGQLHPGALRVLVAWWYVFVLLLSNSYNSNIVADITLPSFTAKINTVQQLVEQHFSWGRPYSEDDLSKHLDYQKYWHRQFAKNFIVYNESNQRRLLLTNKLALSTQRIAGSHYLFLEVPVDAEVAGSLRLMKEKIRTYRCAIAVRKYSPLLPSFNLVLQRLLEAGLVQHFQQDAVRRFQNPAYDKISLDTGPGFHSHVTPLSMGHYKYMFYTLFLGWALSFVCFLVELSFSGRC